MILENIYSMILYYQYEAALLNNSIMIGSKHSINDNYLKYWLTITKSQSIH